MRAFLLLRHPLKALRKLSRELDSNSSPYVCIVSVLMLREGWDVRNVTKIVPSPYVPTVPKPTSCPNKPLVEACAA
jgi:hypothetical protein